MTDVTGHMTWQWTHSTKWGQSLLMGIFHGILYDIRKDRRTRGDFPGLHKQFNQVFHEAGYYMSEWYNQDTTCLSDIFLFLKKRFWQKYIKNICPTSLVYQVTSSRETPRLCAVVTTYAYQGRKTRSSSATRITLRTFFVSAPYLMTTDRTACRDWDRSRVLSRSCASCVSPSRHFLETLLHHTWSNGSE